MRIIGHGIDSAKVAEIKANVDSADMKWTEQFCSADERACAGTTPGRYRYYASCFAAKEAVAKALGTGFRGRITWRGIEVLRREGGAPYIRLRDEVLDLATGMGITDWLISITYLDEVATASVIAVGGRDMAFWSSETVRVRTPAEGLIEPYDPGRVMRGAYELSVGNQAYVTSNTGERTKLGDGERIVIPPGQFGLLITKEVVSVPGDAMAFLSIKSTTKLQGLVNVSGFHVDPGYKNTLKFAVYNAGPQTIYLDQGQPMFLIWYAALDRATEDLYKPRPGLSRDITAEDVKRIAGEVASPARLKQMMDELQSRFDKRMHELETEAEKRTHELKTSTDKRVHSVEVRQTIVQRLLIAAIMLLIGLIAKSSLDRFLERSMPAPTIGGTQAPATKP